MIGWYCGEKLLFFIDVLLIYLFLIFFAFFHWTAFFQFCARRMMLISLQWRVRSQCSWKNTAVQSMWTLFSLILFWQTSVIKNVADFFIILPWNKKTNTMWQTIDKKNLRSRRGLLTFARLFIYMLCIFLEPLSIQSIVYFLIILSFLILVIIYLQILIK